MGDASFIVGDAGGTSTQWRVVEEGKIFQLETIGFNAYTHSINDFKDDIVKVFKNKIIDARVYLYAAGVDVAEQKSVVEKELSKVFKKEVTAENDLLGVARSLCGDQSGNVCILGTGANACFYDGESVNKVGASLGYILGDEGSGAYLGKQLLSKVFRGQIEKSIIDKFNNEFALTSHEAILKIYNQPKPNYFLSSFAPFLYENRNHPDVYQLVQEAFGKFFDAFYLGNEHTESFHFSGSIAFHFSDILRQVGSDKGFGIRNIVQSPIAGLVLYHQQHG